MMLPTEPVFASIIAANDGQVEHFPLPYQILCIVLTALFLWSFSIARDPRGWRRLYQAKFSKNEDFSVNKNKQIDEAMKKWGILIAMMFLVVDVTFFLLGVTYRYRNQQRQTTREEQFRASEVDRVNIYETKGSSRKQAF
jgi:hypothetical protein